jgi:hypothetical protein
MAAFWAVFTFGGSGPAITAHGSLDLKFKFKFKLNTLGSCLFLLLLISDFSPKTISDTSLLHRPKVGFDEINCSYRHVCQ